MSPSLLLLLLLLLVPLSYSTGQPPFSPPSTGSPLPPNYGVSFRPSVAIVIGIFAVMFSLTFLLLMYAKFCHVAASGLFGSTGANALDHNPFLPPPPSQPRFSGVDKILIDSLPFFRFSHLRGARDGLECAVCLSKFDDAEILRLLPKCKHAFHIACVDQWLESHSSCPLCRHRVDAQDVAAHAYSASTRMLLRSSPPSSDRRARDDLHLFVERVPSDAGQHHDGMQAVNFRLSYHKFKHRVIVSDVMMKSRWSDVSSSDLVALNSEMLRTASSRRLTGHGKAEEADERLSMKCLMPVGGRSVSEITNFSRFPEGAAAAVARGNERVRKVWLPMARRTVQWLAGREGREQLQYTREVPEV